MNRNHYLLIYTFFLYITTEKLFVKLFIIISEDNMKANTKTKISGDLKRNINKFIK